MHIVSFFETVIMVSTDLKFLKIDLADGPITNVNLIQDIYY